MAGRFFCNPHLRATSSGSTNLNSIPLPVQAMQPALLKKLILLRCCSHSAYQKKKKSKFDFTWTPAHPAMQLKTAIIVTNRVFDAMIHLSESLPLRY